MNGLLWLAATILVAYLLLLVGLYFVQGALIFPGSPASPMLYKSIVAKELRLDVSGASLQGWESSGSISGSDKIILYFGGNAEDVGARFETLKLLAASSVISFNYRGYGNSDGQPSQKSLYSDAEKIFAYLQSQYPDKRVVVMGRSLGSAVAAHIAAKYQIEKLILITPLHSVEKIARGMFYNLLPRFIVRHPFRVAHLSKTITIPALVLTASHDQVIPNEHSLLTFQALAGPKQLVEIKNAYHNDILDKPGAIDAINDFISKAQDRIQTEKL